MSPMLHITGQNMTDEQTDQAAQAGARVGMFRQCSIGWHEECSDPSGDECRCVCHVEDNEPDYPSDYQGEVLG